jgi:uncharacterized OsmC-like protein
VVLAEEIDVPFPEITLTITAKTDASAEQLKEVQEMLPIVCPVSRVFRRRAEISSRSVTSLTSF